MGLEKGDAQEGCDIGGWWSLKRSRLVALSAGNLLSGFWLAHLLNCGYSSPNYSSFNRQTEVDFNFLPLFVWQASRISIPDAYFRTASH